MEALKSKFTLKERPVAMYDFDGYRIEYIDWWFNVRPSNTEPYLRLVIEANDEALLIEKRGELEAVLSDYVSRGDSSQSMLGI